MSTGLKANVDGSAAIQVGGVDAITLTSAGAASFVTSPMTIQGGSAAAPSLTFSGDTNTGIFSPAADTIAFSEGGVESMRIDSSGNVGIGTSSPGARLQVTDGNFNQLYLNSTTTVCGVRFGNSGSTNGYIYYDNGANLTFQTNGAERARITSGGDFLVGTTTNDTTSRITTRATAGATNGLGVYCTTTGATGAAVFFNPNGQVGAISVSGTATAYITSSDYRLKHDIQPMTGALAKVAQLKPCTYKWNADDSESQGFIAHELAEVVPEAVSGEKDAVDDEGNIKPQGIDTSFLVATLTAAIKELKAELDATKAEVALLKGAA